MVSVLEHRIPPPIVAGILAVLMWWLAPEFPPLLGHGIKFAVAIALAAAGLGLALAAVAQFARARTTISPLEPEAASKLVTGGVFRISRNPMYLAVACLMLAWAVHLDRAWALAGPAAFAAFITRFQIVPEERALAQKFGAEFDKYRHSVRRWL